MRIEWGMQVSKPVKMAPVRRRPSRVAEMLRRRAGAASWPTTRANRSPVEVHNYKKAVTRIRGAIANEAMQGKRPALDPVLDALRVLQKNVGAGS